MCPADISVKNLFHRHTVVHNVDKAQCKVRNKKDNVAGNQTSRNLGCLFLLGWEQKQIHLLPAQKKMVCLVCESAL